VNHLNQRNAGESFSQIVIFAIDQVIANLNGIGPQMPLLVNDLFNGLL
jgi:hypothetical protein